LRRLGEEEEEEGKGGQKGQESRQGISSSFFCVAITRWEINHTCFLCAGCWRQASHSTRVSCSYVFYVSGSNFFEQR